LYENCPKTREDYVDRRILELALEALNARRASIVSEIEGLKHELAGGGATTSPAVKAVTAPAVKAVTAPAAKAVTAPAAKAVTVKSKRRKRTAAFRKAQSERMKALWAKRKAKQAQPKEGKGKKG
jgi:hypothetical protein